MTIRLTLGAVALLLVSVGPLRAEPDKDADRIAALIGQLADERFARREAAVKGIEAIGEKALPAVRAATKSTDLEVRTRATRLVRILLLGCRKSKSLGLETALVDPGEFTMGSPRGEYYRQRDEVPHKVRITRPFLLGTYEVTQEEYRTVTKQSPSWWAATGEGKDRVKLEDTNKYPVEQVTWFDAVDFCNKLSKLDGYAPYYTLADVKREGQAITAADVTVGGGNGYRLPTEAEWEYACRAGTISPFHYGYGGTGAFANLKPGAATGYGAAPNWSTPGRTVKAGNYAKNPWGLSEMHGNAAEWCEDWYDADTYSTSPVDDPIGPPKGRQKVLRGGSWLVNEWSCRSASRVGHAPGERTYYAGFRVARTP